MKVLLGPQPMELPGRLGASKSWFYPGGPTGEGFVYPKPRAMQLAQRTRNVLAMPAAARLHRKLPNTASGMPLFLLLGLTSRSPRVVVRLVSSRNL
jgi:hypothetical protein